MKIKFCEINQQIVKKRYFLSVYFVALWVFQEVDFVFGMFIRECPGGQYCGGVGLIKAEKRIWVVHLYVHYTFCISHLSFLLFTPLLNKY